MDFKELVSPSLTDLFVQELTNMILSGKLKIGEKLPTERQLAEKMKVSLAVVHGGITRLTANGFLRVAPRKGVFVADYIRNGNIYTLKYILDFTGDNFDPNILEPISELRYSIESAAMKKACENRTEKSLAILSELLEQISNSDSTTDYSEIGYAFHHEIAVASGNMYYPMLTETFKPLYIVFYEMYLTIEDPVSITKKLQNLLNAIRQQDAQTAEMLLNKTIANWVKSLKNNMHKSKSINMQE